MYSLVKSLYFGRKEHLCILFVSCNMKNTKLILLLPCILLIAWCSRWDKKTNIVDTNIEIESCNKYFHLIDCIIDKDNDSSYSDNMREELRQEIKTLQSQRELLDKDTLDQKCQNELKKYDDKLDELKSIWCRID